MTADPHKHTVPGYALHATAGRLVRWLVRLTLVSTSTLPARRRVIRSDPKTWELAR
jgi:hypothetical protein